MSRLATGSETGEGQEAWVGVVGEGEEAGLGEEEETCHRLVPMSQCFQGSTQWRAALREGRGSDEGERVEG